jgi:tRNA threonylcarbamoyladenosine biosynthesis protein TsaE
VGDLPPGWVLRAAVPSDAAAVSALTRAAFAGQEVLDPPSGATRETVDDVASWLARHGGFVVVDDRGALAAVARYQEHEGGLWLRRVAVRPDVRGRGLVGPLLEATEQVAERRGFRGLRAGVRTPLVANQAYWRRRGFRVVADRGFWHEMVRPLAVRASLPTAADTRALGERLAGLLRAGDLVLLTGDLGAGKTTLAQGLGAGLGVRGALTSPTFVIARVHPPLGAGPPLVHVDAYRLGDLAEVDDLDLDASLDESVTVVEWGEGKVEGLADDRLDVVLRRPPSPDDETRTALLRGVGGRWAAVDLAALAAGSRAASQMITEP